MAEPRGWKKAGRELALIVMGVLVALAVDSWWSGVGERRDEGRYLAALEAEMAANLNSIEFSLERRAQTAASLATAIRLLESDQYADSAATFIGSLINAGIYRSRPQVNQAVFEDLNSTGSFRLIRDDDLRRRIRLEYARLAINWDRLGNAQAQVRGRLDAMVAKHAPPGVLERPEPLEVIVIPESAELRDVAVAIAEDPSLWTEINATAFGLETDLGYLEFARQGLAEYEAILDSVSAGRGGA